MCGPAPHENLTSETPTALTYESVMQAGGTTDFSPRLANILARQFPEMDQSTSVVIGLGMSVLLEAIEDGRLIVPEEKKHEGFEDWFLGLSVSGLHKHYKPQANDGGEEQI